MDPPPTEPQAPLIKRSVGRYHLHELIGRGGMGDVYRSRDERLNRDVAIKVLPPHLSGEETSRKRFIRETNLASKIIHPYVATVFDVVEDGTDLYLVMEYIEGRRLSHVLREDRPGADQILTWGVEIAEALAAIHRTGLVHRDLKPSNVMITDDGHVKVMDFGLARPVSPPVDARDDTVLADTNITAEGAGVGTLLYMSPEQLRGLPADRRSDLFAFGILLYESVTGIHPFERGTVRDSVSAILNDSPRGGADPDTLTQTGEVRAVLHRLLEKEPDRRYQSSEELLEDLGAASQTLRKSFRVIHPSRRSLAVIGGLAGLLVAAVAVAGYWLSRPPVWDGPRYSIAVAPFHDRTGDEDGPIRAGMVADLLTSDLESSRLLRAVGPRRTAPLLEGIPDGAGSDEIARRVLSGALVDYVLLGTLYREGDRYLATMEFVPANEQLPELPALRSEAGSGLALAEALARSMRHQLPEVSALNAWRDDRTDLAEIRSESEEANLLYEMGRQLMREGKIAEAIARYEQAVELDPGFAIAQTMLARALHHAGYGRRAREVADKALALAPTGGSRAEERLAMQIRATRAEVYGRTEDLVEVTGRLSASFPDEPAMLRLNAEALKTAGTYEEALRRVDQALLLDPLAAGLHRLRAELLILTREFDSAAASLDRAAELFRQVDSTSGLAGVEYVKGQLLAEQDRFEEAVTVLAGAAASFQAVGDEIHAAETSLQIADIDMLQGKAAAAREPLEAARDAARRVGHQALECRALSSDGARMFLAGDLDGAEPRLREASDLARRLENDLQLIFPLSNLASLLTYEGRLDEARPLLKESFDVAQRLNRKNEEIKVLLLLSDVDYQLGDLDAAIRSYREIVEARKEEGASRISLWAFPGLAEILEQRGRLAEALDACDRAIPASRELSVQDVLGYTLFRRSQILAALGRGRESSRDVEEAEKIASSAQTGLQDLRSRCALARAAARIFEGRWDEAVTEAEKALSLVTDSGMSVAARAMLCKGLLETNRHRQALAACREAVHAEAAPRSQTVIARSFLVEALHRAGHIAEARDEGQACLREAERLGLLLPQARVAAALLALPDELRPPEPERIRRQGRESLEAYLDAVPEVDRPAVTRRTDLRRMTAILLEPLKTNAREADSQALPGG